MLHTPGTRRPSSSLPTLLIVVACAAVAVYFAFFRGKPPAPLAQAPAAEPAAPRVEQRPAAFVAPPVLEAPVVPKAPEPKPEPPKPPPPPSLIEEIDAMAAAGRLGEARARLAPAFASSDSDAERLELARRAVDLNRRLLQDKADSPDIELYEIRQGDTLDSIARKFKAYNGVKGQILLLNNYKENAVLRDGRKVRVSKGTWSIFVDKSMYLLWICYEGAPFRQYRVTVGAPHKETPPVKYVVGNRNPKPAWWPPADMKVTGKIPVPYGDPQNPLGEWWISLEHDLHHGIGIHGTNDPGAIGTKASNGCVRMVNEEVGDVAAICYKGMIVTVVE